MGYTPSFTPEYENGWEDLPLETTPITADALNNYDEGIEKIEEYLASDNSQANLADAYDETATYEAGDYVIYGGDLYKCLEDIDEPEEWDITKWESCLITDEMATSGVEANPQETATDTLTKIKIDDTVYGVSGGGGNANIWTGTQAELEEVFDELEEGTQINITDDEERTQAFVIYSTDEQVIGTWIDGSTLYQKTIEVSSTEVDNHTKTDSDITNADVLLIEDGYYMINNGLKLALNQFETASAYTRTGFRDDNSLYFYVNGYTSCQGAVLTVRYTKSSS